MSTPEDVWQIRTDRPFKDAYWAYMHLRGEIGARFPRPALAWWMQGITDPQLNPTEQVILEYVERERRILDIGAGDLRIKHRLTNAGFKGRFETVDVSSESIHDFGNLDDAPTGAFDAVLVLEVIEHITLDDFDSFVDGVLRVLAPGGKLVISTPNAACISSIWSGDMTHRHAYSLIDLAAYLQLRGVRTEHLYRVNWSDPSAPLSEKARQQIARFLLHGILKVDYCRGVLLLGEKTEANPNRSTPT